MSNKNYWATKHEKGWAVKREGNQKVTSIHQTRAEAWEEAKERARETRGEALLQNRHGQIRERNTYSNDPYPPKG